MNLYRVPDIAKKYIDYDMIQAHTELPAYSQYRARLLYAFLNRSKLFRKHSELFTLVTSLVQLALDTHERVENASDHEEEKQIRSKQLKVLAGDYLSSRFYQLLSQAGQIDIIRMLSWAICEVNRIKMNLYVKMKQVKITAEEYLHQSVEMNSKLFLSFSHCMDGLYEKEWPELLYRFTKCEFLLEELKRMDKLEEFPHSWGYWYLLQQADRKELTSVYNGTTRDWQQMLEKYRIRDHLLGLIQSQIEEIQKRINRLESDLLQGELKNLKDTITHAFTSLKLLKEV